MSTAAPSAAGQYIVVASAAPRIMSPLRHTVAFAIKPSAGLAQPTVQVSVTGGTYTGSAWTTSATVTAPSGTPTGSLEGVSPTYVYFDNQSRPLTGAATEGGSYTVLALFGGSTDYAAATATAMFTIRQANPILTVTAPGGTFDGRRFLRRPR